MLQGLISVMDALQSRFENVSGSHRLKVVVIKSGNQCHSRVLKQTAFLSISTAKMVHGQLGS